ncbi:MULTISPECIES: Rap family tetratricopeptide repeat protein [Bacillus]|uniref:Rap family tetratricopeptide repeat protein n=1 Tax=Bacillus TaxID=1386 RepID=UPI00040DD64D|nr:MULTISPECIES: Rap family tetratricopeptide repeat protein [Bacillus]QHZ48349.1 tetratricopeptide repeat protein [Bacillus sp. NSP9.1]
MEAKIAFEKVGKMLNDWYSSIRQNNIQNATKMKDEIQSILPNMKENQNVLLYFNLIDSRFKLMTEDYNESGNLLDDIKSKHLESCTDDMIQYYFYFFSGLYEFYQKRFTKAINFYRIAESRLHKIPDEIERAEFNYQVAIAYYEIRQNYFSLNHAEKALESFQADGMYSNRTATCQMVIACNKMDLFQYNEAEDIFKKAIQEAAQANEKSAEALGYFNLGICYERQEKLDEARQSFESALDIPEHQRSVYSVRSMYMLTRVLCKKGLVEEAEEWYKKAIFEAAKAGETTYEAKLNIIKFLYLELDETLLEKGFNVLKENSLWSDVSDLSQNAGIHFKKKEHPRLAAKYFEEALNAKDQIQRLTEGIDR